VRDRRKVKLGSCPNKRKEKYMYEFEIKEAAARLGVSLSSFKRMLKNNRIGFNETVGY